MNIIEKILGRRIKDNVRLGKAFALGLMATTFFFANKFAMEKVGGMLPPALVALSPYIALALAFGVSYMVDHKLFQNTVEAFTARMSPEWPRLKRHSRIAANILMFVVVARFSASTCMTVASIWFAANSATEQVSAKADRKADAVQSESSALRAEVAAIRKDYLSRAEAAMKAARDKGAQKIEDALASGGSNWRRLYESEDPYLMSTSRKDIAAYRKRIASARKEADRLESSARKEADRLTTVMDNQIAQARATASSSIDILGKGYNNSAAKAQTQLLIFSSFGWLLDFLFAGMTLLMSYLIAAWASSQQDPESALEELFAQEHGFLDVLTTGLRAVKMMLVSWSSRGTAALSLAGALQMEKAAAQVAEATTAHQRAKEMYKEAARPTPVQQQQGSSTPWSTPDNGSQQQEHCAPSEESFKDRGEEHSPEHIPSPPLDNAEKKEEEHTAPTLEEGPVFVADNSVDNSGQHESTAVERSTLDNSQDEPNGQQQKTAERAARKAAAKEAVKALRRKGSVYKGRAKKYALRAKAEQDQQERIRLIALAKENAQRAKSIELEIVNSEKLENE